MLRAYFNYPNSIVRVHHDPTCGHVQQMKKIGQRIVTIRLSDLGTELGTFGQNKHDFGSTADRNDMWLQVESGDAVFDDAVVAFVHRALARRYRPFASATVETHC